MDLIRGDPVTVIRRASGRDAHGRPTGAETAETVANALVAPVNSQSESVQGDGQTAQMYVPRGYTADLAGCDVVAGGVRYSVVGVPTAYPSRLTPGPWDRVALLSRAAERGAGS